MGAGVVVVVVDGAVVVVVVVVVDSVPVPIFQIFSTWFQYMYLKLKLQTL